MSTGDRNILIVRFFSPVFSVDKILSHPVLHLILTKTLERRQEKNSSHFTAQANKTGDLPKVR